MIQDAVFIDLTKAFDTVFHEGLWKVLGKCEYPSKFINLVKALHDKMQAHVAQGNYIFKEFAVTNDVKQGSVLAPKLFSFYWTAMPEVAFDGVGNRIYIQSHTNPDLFNVTLFRAKTRTTQILVREMLFAGDSAIVAHSVADIQSLEDKIARAASQFGLKINIKKTEYFTGQCNT